MGHCWGDRKRHRFWIRHSCRSCFNHGVSLDHCSPQFETNLYIIWAAVMFLPSTIQRSGSHWPLYTCKVGAPTHEPAYTMLTRLLAFGRDGSLAIWSFMCVAQIMMTASLLLPASRQAFAFARDGALPFSGYFYSVNKKTQTPVRSEFTNYSLRIPICSRNLTASPQLSGLLSDLRFLWVLWLSPTTPQSTQSSHLL